MAQPLFMVLLHLSLISVGVADAAVITTARSNAWGYGTGGGIIGFIILALDILVFGRSRRDIVSCVQR